MQNLELAKLFSRMGDLLEILGENRFRINSYRRTARILKDLPEDIGAVAEEGRLESLSGVGKATAQKIQQYLDSGAIDELAELESNVPQGLPALLDIPGMGPKKVAAVWKELNVQNIADLKRVVESGQLADLSGFGAQSVAKIASGIEFLEQTGSRIPLGEALPIAELVAEYVRNLDGVQQVEIAGSIRRGQETIGDIDLLCVADSGAGVVEKFVQMDVVDNVLAAGETKGSVVLPLDNGSGVQVDLRVVPEESYGAALQYFSGSKEHNVRLRERAVKRGLKLNEWGLFKGDQRIAGERESDIYAALDLPLIPVELREDRGEFELGSPAFENLVQLEDIRGDLHMHTTASDGRSTLEEMVSAARQLGYEYINIADHSKSSAIANGLSIKQMEKQLQTVRALGKKLRDFKVMVGCECDILSDGSLDYPDDLLAECDIVVASMHVALGQDRKTITRRAIRAVEHPHVHILGHPTGRLLNRRAASELDVSEVIKVAVATGTALEINASSKRLDLKDSHVRLAVDQGATLSINTDSHHVDQLKQMRYGVTTARRGWVPRECVINTYKFNRLQDWKRNLSK